MDMHKMNSIMSLPVIIDFNVMNARANMPTNMSHIMTSKHQFPYLMSAHKWLLGNGQWQTVACLTSYIYSYLACGHMPIDIIAIAIYIAIFSMP